MPYLTARCSQCNGALQFDESMATGYCIYCGTKMVVKEAVELHRISAERSFDIKNLLFRAEHYYEDNQLKDAEKCYNRVLSLEATNSTAWWGKYKISNNADAKCIILNGHSYGVSSLTHDNRKRIQSETKIDIIYLLNVTGAIERLSIRCWDSRYALRAIKYSDQETKDHYERLYEKDLSEYEALRSKNDYAVREFIAEQIYLYDKTAADLAYNRQKETIIKIVKNVVIVVVLIILVYSFIY